MVRAPGANVESPRERRSTVPVGSEHLHGMTPVRWSNVHRAVTLDKLWLLDLQWAENQAVSETTACWRLPEEEV